MTTSRSSKLLKLAFVERDGYRVGTCMDCNAVVVDIRAGDLNLAAIGWRHRRSCGGLRAAEQSVGWWP